MTVQFNLEEDSRFSASLQDLGADEAVAVVDTLEGISDLGLSWDVFVENARWIRLPIEGADLYPGGNVMHAFLIELPSGALMEIAGYTYDEIVVVCAIARHAPGG